MRSFLLATLAALVLALQLVACGPGHDWQKVAEDDPAIEAARQKSRETFPEFLAAYKKRQPMDAFVVEVFYQSTEYITIRVTELSETEVTGDVLSHPSHVSLKSGETITIPLGDLSILSEWAINTADGEPIGGYVSQERSRLSHGG